MEEMSPNLKRSSTTKRFLNYLIDLIFYLILSFMLGLVAGILLAISGNIDFIETPAFEAIINVFTLALIFLYYFIFELAFGATPAKFITGTRVTTRDGQKPEAGAIALRSLIRFVPFEPFSFLFGEGWHDKWSKTIVIDKN